MPDAAAPCWPPLPWDVNLSPDLQLAVACSWIAPEPWEDRQNAKVASICDAGVDWGAFLQQVDRHGIAVQALSVLRRCKGLDVPEDVYGALKARNKRITVRSFMQTGELIRISRLLKAHDIDMIALKGVVLSQRLYGSPHVRTSGDIDVLVRPEDLAAVDRLLVGIGYRNVDDLTERQTDAFLVRSHHLNYVREENGQHLELHWQSHFWSRDDMEELWQNRKTITLSGEQLAFLDDPALFLFLCDHGSRHLWFRLKWLGDIGLMLSDKRIGDWELTLKMADRLGFRRILAQTALLIHGLYAISMPPELLNLMGSEKISIGLAKKALNAILKETNECLKKGRKLEGIKDAIYYKQIRPALPFGRLLKEVCICPLDYQAFPLPDHLFWLYLPLRPVFWFWRHYGGRFFAKFRLKAHSG